MNLNLVILVYCLWVISPVFSNLDIKKFILKCLVWTISSLLRFCLNKLVHKICYLYVHRMVSTWVCVRSNLFSVTIHIACISGFIFATFFSATTSCSTVGCFGYNVLKGFYWYTLYICIFFLDNRRSHGIWFLHNIVQHMGFKSFFLWIEDCSLLQDSTC